MDNPVELLQQMGFSDYEARAYVTLLQRSPLNGYELAKASGLPRANVYAVLVKLEERGAVVRVDTPAGARYSAVPAKELVSRLDNHFRQSLAATEQSLADMQAPPDREAVWNIGGYDAVLDHARAFIETARQQLIVGVWPQESAALAPVLRAASGRGLSITTLCLASCAHECGGCQGHIYRYRAAPGDSTPWLMVVADDGEVLVGEIGAKGVSAIRTRQRLVIDLASWFIRHSIAVAAILNDLGDSLDTQLRPETRAILAGVGAAGQNEGWLGSMRRLLSRPGGAG